MKAIFTNYRYYILIVVLGLAISCLFAFPCDNTTLAVAIYVLVSTKLLAFVFGYLFAGLYYRWEAKGTIPELVNFVQNF